MPVLHHSRDASRLRGVELYWSNCRLKRRSATGRPWERTLGEVLVFRRPCLLSSRRRMSFIRPDSRRCCWSRYEYLCLLIHRKEEILPGSLCLCMRDVWSGGAGLAGRKRGGRRRTAHPTRLPHSYDFSRPHLFANAASHRSDPLKATANIRHDTEFEDCIYPTRELSPLLRAHRGESPILGLNTPRPLLLLGYNHGQE